MKKGKRIAVLLNVLAIMAFAVCGVAEAQTDAGSETESPPAAVVTLVRGTVEIKRAGAAEWTPAQEGDALARGDMLRVGADSQAAVRLADGNLAKLDDRTTLTVTGTPEKKHFFIRMLEGAAHFFSNRPRSLTVETPFVNAVVEGTEFLVRVSTDNALIAVFQGRVLAENAQGRLVLADGQSAVTYKGKAPALFTMVKQRDAAAWALFYPPVDDFRSLSDASLPGLAQYRAGDIPGALAALAAAPEPAADVRFHTFRAMLKLSVGQVEDARADIDRALAIRPEAPDALAIDALMAVVQGDRDTALDRAARAVAADPNSAAARHALSYALQARFDLAGALKSAEAAAEAAPDSALALARVAELRQSLGDLDGAERDARQALTLAPDLSRAHTVLGFALLARFKAEDAETRFAEAVRLDAADPLARLGLGLARIRQGRLEDGRADMEIAAALDPGNALIRSYLGKAFYEEKRNPQAARELAAAKALDPNDPTPWLYDAIRKQTENRPVEALQDLETAVALNDNRAVYRSRLALDQDLAARGVGLARIYDDLGFQELALREGWRSVNTDPANHSAHRFLADAYAALPRHEIARVSELLQSQLLQPVSINPVQPRLADIDSQLLPGAWSATPGYNEYTPLFDRDRLALQAAGVYGSNDTFGEELVHSGVAGRFSYSVGQFHYETDGTRDNNDREYDLYNAFVQMAVTPSTQLQAEVRYSDSDAGDLTILFDPDDFLDRLRQQDRRRFGRIGLAHALTPRSKLVFSALYGNTENDSRVQEERELPGPLDMPVTLRIDNRIRVDIEGVLTEGQYLWQGDRINVVAGVGYFDEDADWRTQTRFQSWHPILGDLSLEEGDTLRNDETEHLNAYVYAHLRLPAAVVCTVGASLDMLDSFLRDEDQFNPKFGVAWTPVPGTTVRAAVFRTLERSLISGQTVEPTQVAGFNQFFSDSEGTEAWRYGLGVDQTILENLRTGAEIAFRSLNQPFFKVASTGELSVAETDWDEDTARAYLYWTPHERLTLSAEYLYEKMKSDRIAPGLPPELYRNMTTHRLPVGARLFLPCGFMVRLTATYVKQDYQTFDPNTLAPLPDDDRFWIMDAGIGFRLPGRRGLVSVEARNLFDEDFKFQDTDYLNPAISYERQIFAKVSLSF